MTDELPDNVIPFPVRYPCPEDMKQPKPGEPGYFGTWTPPAPYGDKKREDDDNSCPG